MRGPGWRIDLTRPLTLSDVLIVERLGGPISLERTIASLERNAGVVLSGAGYPHTLSKLVEKGMPDSDAPEPVQRAAHVLHGLSVLSRLIVEGKTGPAAAYALQIGAIAADCFGWHLIKDKQRAKKDAGKGGREGAKSRLKASQKARETALSIARESSLKGRGLAAHVARQLQLRGVVNRKTKLPYDAKTVGDWLKKSGK